MPGVARGQVQLPEEDAEEDADDDDDLDDMPMYFQRPTQLLDIFAQLEEQNLFLIQNCQVGGGILQSRQVEKCDGVSVESEVDAM